MLHLAFFTRKYGVSSSSIYYISPGKDFEELNVILKITENCF